MISSAELVTLACVASALGAGPGPYDATATARVAELWRVAPATVRLEWGRIPPGASTLPTSMRLVGSGAGGWFTAVIGRGDSTLAVRVRAGIETSVPVAAHALERGAGLAASDLDTRTETHWGAPAGVGDVPGAGWVVRRPIASGEVVAPPAVGPPPLIKSGDPIRMTWTRGGVSVTRVGVALNSARRGERVHARFDGHTQLEGLALEPGLAMLPGGER